MEIENNLPVNANIPLILNSYIDIFSSFDPRPYSERALSDDFLIECKRAARDKEENAIELVLAIPNGKRNLNDELKIKKRLREHFRRHFQSEQAQLSHIRKQGFAWFGLGTFFILLLSWLHMKAFSGFFMNIITTMLEPAGWFSFWEGLGKIFIVTEEKSGDYKFYKKMADCEVVFTGY